MIQKNSLKNIWILPLRSLGKLKDYCIYPLERRREQYIVIYAWKIIEGLIPNIGSSIYNTGLCINPILQTGRINCVDKLEESCLSFCGLNTIQFAFNID